MNQFSPQCSLHWHWQHCELAPVVKEHISWYNDVENHSSFANQITSAVVGQHPTSQPPDRAATSTETLSGGEERKGATSESPKLQIMGLFSSQYLAFLSHFRFWKGICKVARWIGLEILVPKHPWKSKIEPLQPILPAKRYVSFFLGHPVQTLALLIGYYCHATQCKAYISSTTHRILLLLL